MLKITLTTDPEQKAKLERKLAEYEKRLKYQAPEVDPHATYKRLILERLLKKGAVVAPSFYGELAKEFGWHDFAAFDDAFKLIGAYNANDLTKVRGGTGLK